MNNDLQNYLNSILQQKVEYITPENIKEGVTVLGVNGDVTELNGQNITITPTTEVQDIAPDENYNGITHITVEAVTSNISPNILPDNIKLGVEVLGVVGNLELIDTNGFFEVPTNVNRVNIIQCIKQIPSLNIENITSLAYMFLNCIKLEGVPNLNTSNVTNMYWMFGNCTNLGSVPNFDTKNVESMTTMFDGCINFSICPNFDISNVTQMSYTFRNCKSLEEIPNFNTINVINMYGTFMYSGIKYIPNWDYSNVIYTENTFFWCENIKYVNNLYLNSSIDCTRMFSLDRNLISVDNLFIPNCVNMVNMFHGCNNLLYVNFLNTDSIYNCVNAFTSCDNLIYVNNLNLHNVSNTFYMFSYCDNLKSIHTVDSNTYKLKLMGSMFRNCTNLENIPIFNLSNLGYRIYGYYFDYSFTNCYNLSNNSLYNIIKSVSVLNAYTTNIHENYYPRLENLGLSEEQSNICVNFDIWQDCVNNGWTTGY